jgi:tetratricopeptide (TPR) repeat protein
MVPLRHILAIVALCACAMPARAQQSDDQMTRARTHFEAGRALYQLGNYNEALREFGAGYQLAPRPQFLLNLGQCYRKLDDLANARSMYQRYLHDAPASDPERTQAEQILVEIEKQIADREAAQAPPPVAAPAAPHAQLAAQPGATTTLTATAPPPRKSWIKRNWWVIPVGAVVVGAAVGLGVYYGTRAPDPCAGANLTCWDLSK